MRRLGIGIAVACVMFVGRAPALAAPPGRARLPTIENPGPEKPAPDRAAGRGGRRGRSRPELRGVVNLNQADQDTLELLPGIGAAKSARIVEHRRAHPFRRVDELTRVKGIGRKTLARLKPWLAVSGASTLHEESGDEEGRNPDSAGAGKGGSATPK